MFAVSNHAKSSSVLMIFNHQDIPSIVGISCQGLPSFSRKISGYIVVYQYQCYYDVRSFKVMQGLALSVLMVLSHQDVSSFLACPVNMSHL